MRLVLFAAACLFSPLASTAQQSPEAPISVMIVGTVHLANPSRDLHNVAVDNVLTPAHKAELARIADSLARFHPTAVMAEWPAELVTRRFDLFRKGTLPPSKNEVVQIDFRLAAAAHIDRVYGIDADGDFPYEAVQTFAKAHGQEDLLARINAHTEAMVHTEQSLLDTKGIPATLRYLNEPATIREGNFFYSQMLHIGAGAEQPGATLLAAWYKRNALICANLIQNARPGDRIVAVFGAGHAFLLRQCIAQTPGFRLIEANDYLPK